MYGQASWHKIWQDFCTKVSTWLVYLVHFVMCLSFSVSVWSMVSTVSTCSNSSRMTAGRQCSGGWADVGFNYSKWPETGENLGRREDGKTWLSQTEDPSHSIPMISMISMHLSISKLCAALCCSAALCAVWLAASCRYEVLRPCDFRSVALWAQLSFWLWMSVWQTVFWAQTCRRAAMSLAISASGRKCLTPSWTFSASVHRLLSFTLSLLTTQTCKFDVQTINRYE